MNFSYQNPSNGFPTNNRQNSITYKFSIAPLSSHSLTIILTFFGGSTSILVYLS